MSTETKLWHLENFNILKALSLMEKMKMAKKIKDSKVEKNEYIYFPEDPSSSIYFLKKGRVKIGSYSDNGKEIIKTILGPGEIFGELSLVDEGKRKDFAIALDNNVKLCAMSINDMEAMMGANSMLGLKVTKLIGFRLQKVERRLEALVFKDARTRIIDFIKQSIEDHGRRIGVEWLFRHSLTHQDMANITCTSRQTVTLVLNDLKRHDLIHFNRGKILVRDMNKLQ